MVTLTGEDLDRDTVLCGDAGAAYLEGVGALSPTCRCRILRGLSHPGVGFTLYILCLRFYVNFSESQPKRKIFIPDERF